MAAKSKTTRKSKLKSKTATAKLENRYRAKCDVMVVGIGTIGEPLTRLLLDHRDEFGICDVYFAKFTPTDMGTVKLLTNLGGKFVVWSNTLPGRVRRRQGAARSPLRRDRLQRLLPRQDG